MLICDEPSNKDTKINTLVKIDNILISYLVVSESLRSQHLVLALVGQSFRIKIQFTETTRE